MVVAVVDDAASQWVPPNPIGKLNCLIHINVSTVGLSAVDVGRRDAPKAERDDGEVIRSSSDDLPHVLGLALLLLSARTVPLPIARNMTLCQCIEGTYYALGKHGYCASAKPRLVRSQRIPTANMRESHIAVQFPP